MAALGMGVSVAKRVGFAESAASGFALRSGVLSASVGEVVSPPPRTLRERTQTRLVFGGPEKPDISCALTGSSAVLL